MVATVDVAALREIAREGPEFYLAAEAVLDVPALHLAALLAKAIALSDGAEERRITALIQEAIRQDVERAAIYGVCYRCQHRGKPEDRHEQIHPTGPFMCRRCIAAVLR